MNILNIEPERYSPDVRNMLGDSHAVDYLEVEDQPALLKQLSKKPYGALIVSLGIAIDDKVMEAAPDLKYIISPTTGLNHIDLDTASQKGIEIISLKGESEFLAQIQSTSELTWGLLLALIRQIPRAYTDVLARNWNRERFLGAELNGKTLGILGYGRLGRIVAGYGRAFGMQVIVNDTDSKQVENLPDGIRAVDLNELLVEADVLSLHIPYSSENYHFIGRDELMQTKQGLILVNTARGEVLDQDALLEKLESRHIYGAALDVIEGDSAWTSVPENQILVDYASKNNNLLITPHIGGYALESIEGTRAFIIKKFLKALAVS